jgi:hypothetical protein
VGRKKRGRLGEVGPRELLGRALEKEKGRGKSGLGFCLFFLSNFFQIFEIKLFSKFFKL